PKVTNEVVYLSADEEDRYVIAQANAPLDELRGAGACRQRLPAGWFGGRRFLVRGKSLRR
ncbi:MAG: hypothetical protein K6T30_10535, partial [Alicyclobacillus sp.]|nr:hypothetical protein [Alicyclobacillus sp.]